MIRRARFLAVVGVLALIVAAGVTITHHIQKAAEEARSPYVAHQDSPVRGLSQQEVGDLLAGQGAEYARTAELNSYPGPRHALAMKDEPCASC